MVQCNKPAWLIDWLQWAVSGDRQTDRELAVTVRRRRDVSVGEIHRQRRPGSRAPWRRHDYVPPSCWYNATSSWTEGRSSPRPASPGVLHPASCSDLPPRRSCREPNNHHHPRASTNVGIQRHRKYRNKCTWLPSKHIVMARILCERVTKLKKTHSKGDT